MISIIFHGSYIIATFFMNSKDFYPLLRACINAQINAVNLDIGHKALDLEIFELSLGSRTRELSLLIDAIRAQSAIATTGLTNSERIRDSHRNNKTLKTLSSDLSRDIHWLLEKLFCHSDNYSLSFYEAGFYIPGDYFRPHYDYRLKYPSERIRTILVYLENVEEGGELFFPLIDVQVKPSSGLIVSWSNVEENLGNRLLSLHESKEVVKGSKSVLTYFLNRSS